MKNIHIFPTDKPSRLVKFKDETNLLLGSLPSNKGQGYNIYITSDEEIKKGNWYLEEKSKFNPRKLISEEWGDGQHFKTFNQKGFRKIILTTDTDLIADGVQDIDDDFLEWFVKNPNCEEVEVVYDYFQVDQNNPVLIGSTALAEGYKIIIPNQQLINPNNQEVMFHEEHREYFYEDFVDGKFVTVWLGKDYIPKQENSIEAKQRAANYMSLKGALEPKQETLEEFIESYVNRIDRSEDGLVEQCLTDGAKWQQEIMYSEEDLREAFKSGRMVENYKGEWEETYSDEMTSSKYEDFNKWFEQFKKK